MSEVTIFDQAKVPAFAKRRTGLSPMMKSLAGGGGGSSGKRVSIKGGVFRLISEGKEVASIEDRYLDIVIVNAAPDVSRVLYLSKFDPANPAPPDCWSNDGKTPDKSISNPQARSCADCPQNIAGSGNGSSRACKYNQRLAVVLANDIGGDVLQLTLPSTSIFGKEDGDQRPLGAYARWLRAQDVDIGEVVTRMRFDTKSESPKLFFKATRWLEENEFEIAQEKGKTPEAKAAITMTVAKMDNVVSKPIEESISGKRPTKVKAEEVAIAGDDEEPVVRKEEKKPSVVPSKASLADAISNWDDE